jgi:rhodanese-related sulfurtransferase
MLFGNIHKGLAEYQRSPGAVLADVREADEFAGGHIPGAVNLPLSHIHAIRLPKDSVLFLYCLRGSRARKAAGILKKMGYLHVKSIGGITAYQGKLEE